MTNTIFFGLFINSKFKVGASNLSPHIQGLCNVRSNATIFQKLLYNANTIKRTGDQLILNLGEIEIKQISAFLNYLFKIINTPRLHRNFSYSVQQIAIELDKTICLPPNSKNNKNYSLILENAQVIRKSLLHLLTKVMEILKY